MQNIIHVLENKKNNKTDILTLERKKKRLATNNL